MKIEKKYLHQVSFQPGVLILYVQLKRHRVVPSLVKDSVIKF